MFSNKLLGPIPTQKICKMCKRNIYSCHWSVSAALNRDNCDMKVKYICQMQELCKYL